MILFDSGGVPPDSRLDAMRQALRDVTVPTTLIVEERPGQAVSGQMRYWAFGPADLVATSGSGLTLRRDPRHLRVAGPSVVALSMQTAGTGHFEHLGHQQLMPPGSLMLVDLTAPYEFGWTGAGGNQGLQVSYGLLGLTPEVVRAAIGRLEASPLAGLMRHQLRLLSEHGDALGSEAAAAVGAAAADLLRALIVSVVDDDALARAVGAQTLTTRLLAYLHRYLRETDLTPERIAAAHSISVRQLYKLCEQAGLHLEPWLIAQRLEGARAELLSPAAQQRTIAAVARSWGFTNPSHFTRRFRAAYGVSPQEWQHCHQVPARPAPAGAAVSPASR
jgi:AraC-like DNA-binding protein